MGINDNDYVFLTQDEHDVFLLSQTEVDHEEYEYYKQGFENANIEVHRQYNLRIKKSTNNPTKKTLDTSTKKTVETSIKKILDIPPKKNIEDPTKKTYDIV
jgi:hypothetical protein